MRGERHHLNSARRHAAAATLVLAALTAAATAITPGTVDPTFGSDGIVTADFGNTASQVDNLVVLSDGRIIALGRVPSTGGIQVARYLPDGSPDLTFGTNGATDLPELTTLAPPIVLPDGKLVIAGRFFGIIDDELVNALEIIRLNTDGAIDTAFGTDGRQRIALPQIGINIALARLPNGQLITATSVGFSGALILLNADGTLDTNFDGGVIEYLDRDFGFGIIPQPDNSFLVGGRVRGTPDELLVMALNPDGTLRTDYGIGGEFRLPAPGSASSLFVSALDLIDLGARRVAVVANFTDTAKLLQLTADGALDPTFATGGVFTLADPAGRPLLLKGTRDPFGRFVATGWIDVDGTTEEQPIIVRVNPLGTLDADFATGGIFKTDFDVPQAQLWDAATAVDGQLLTGGLVDRPAGNPGSAWLIFKLHAYQYALDRVFAATGPNAEAVVTDTTTDLDLEPSTMQAEDNTSTGESRRALVEFDLTNLPPDGTVTAAELVLDLLAFTSEPAPTLLFDGYFGDGALTEPDATQLDFALATSDPVADFTVTTPLDDPSVVATARDTTGFLGTVVRATPTDGGVTIYANQFAAVAEGIVPPTLNITWTPGFDLDADLAVGFTDSFFLSHGLGGPDTLPPALYVAADLDHDDDIDLVDLAALQVAGTP